jgi:uncharacterized repeat protein (TIGR03803 family)
VVGVLVCKPGQAQTNLQVLYTFTGKPDDADPVGFIRDTTGNLYGTTAHGGTYGLGSVFEVNSSGTETVLYSFTGGADGANPYVGVVRDTAGNIYGTTNYGTSYGGGTVFKVDSTGTFTLLHAFTGKPDGAGPYGGVFRDSAGNLYGTTTYGGTYDEGTVFKVDTTGKESVLYSFCPRVGFCPDGAQPYSGLVAGSAGNLYGTTYQGGSYGAGTVFMVDSTGTEKVLYSFAGGTDGAYPLEGLTRDASGNLYGTTPRGGSGSLCGSLGCGILFKLDSTGKETVVHSFTGGSDGAYPVGVLIGDSVGNLYGATQNGGSATGFSGHGTVFKLDSGGKETVLYKFRGSADGAYPYAGIVRDMTGNIYGTTSYGGSATGFAGYGIVFELTH